MTEQFDAERWLRDMAHTGRGQYDNFMRCADELAALKARILELEAEQAQWEITKNQYGRTIKDFADEVISLRDICKKLYEALKENRYSNSSDIAGHLYCEAIKAYEDR